MCFALIVVALAAVTHPSAAFPASYFEGHPAPLANRTLSGFSGGQLIDVSGDHSYRPPGEGDLRGPCPGLNAMANHNFIPHDGVVTFTDAILQSNLIFGLGLDTGAVAAVLALFGADLLALDFPFSIGGAPTPGLLSGILGSVGIIGKMSDLVQAYHCQLIAYRGSNRLIWDAQPVRMRLLRYPRRLLSVRVRKMLSFPYRALNFPVSGDNYHLQLPYFQALYDLQPAGPSANYDLGIIRQHAQIRFRQSIAQDPYFFYGPLQMLVSCLTHNLVYGLMANHSVECPEGCLSGEVLKSIYSITTAADGTLHYTPGHEQIPHNWYRRPTLDPYSAQHVIPDLLDMWLRYPELLLIGGNTNGVNTYAPIDVGNLTGGIYSAESLLKGNNAACFVFQAVQILVPDALSGLAEIVDIIVSKLLDAIGPLLVGLTCPELKTIDRTMLERYPGYRRTTHAV
ncbi:hypothetical protein MVEN_01828900 [Mycena venus]|uniref:Heme haloperoxidase family profile domain-containing protein n=1 Tax=Mycena venus TaxID=2733690 RepID=A0A8H7CLS4_9AGAR|nr:hypothetical protein MVEN_01828900 [Mycena venus]